MIAKTCSLFLVMFQLTSGAYFNTGSQNGNGFNHGGTEGHSSMYGNGNDLTGSASTDFESAINPIAALSNAIGGGGVPGVDYPILASVPDNGFICDSLPGYYADISDEARCQVFHICQFDGRHDAFLCPNGTIFNQQFFVCDWWFNVDCAASAQFFELNAQIGIVPGQEEGFGNTAAGSAQSISNLYGTPDAGQGNGNGAFGGSGNGQVGGSGNGQFGGSGAGHGNGGSGFGHFGGSGVSQGNGGFGNSGAASTQPISNLYQGPNAGQGAGSVQVPSTLYRNPNNRG